MTDTSRHGFLVVFRSIPPLPNLLKKFGVSTYPKNVKQLGNFVGKFDFFVAGGLVRVSLRVVFLSGGVIFDLFPRKHLHTTQKIN